MILLSLMATEVAKIDQKAKKNTQRTAISACPFRTYLKENILVGPGLTPSELYYDLVITNCVTFS